MLEIRLPRITVAMGEGGFGERGWAVEGMKDRDPFGGQTGLEIGEGVFEGVSNGERIGSILADCGEIDAEDGGLVIGELVAKVLEGEAESDSEEEEEEGLLEKFFHGLRSFPVASSNEPRARTASVRASSLARRVVWSWTSARTRARRSVSPAWKRVSREASCFSSAASSWFAVISLAKDPW